MFAGNKQNKSRRTNPGLEERQGEKLISEGVSGGARKTRRKGNCTGKRRHETMFKIFRPLPSHFGKVEWGKKSAPS